MINVSRLPKTLYRRVSSELVQAKYRINQGKVPFFIHIPKTGGTYLRQLESTYNPVISPIASNGHCLVVKNKKNTNYSRIVGYHQAPLVGISKISKYYVFANVRNIYTWLVSYWKHAGGVKTRYVNKNHYDYKLSQKGFNNFVETIAHRSDPKIWPSKRLIHFALFSDQGDFLPDWINRTKTLDEDLHKLASHKKLSYKKKPKQRVVNKSIDLSKYYNSKLKSLVKKTWGREMKLLGHNFERNNINKSIIKNIIKDKSRFVYDYQKDILKVDGSILK